MLLHRMKPAAPASDVLLALDSLANIRLVPSGAGVVRRAVEAVTSCGIHFSGRAGCSLGGAGRLRDPVFRGSAPRPVLFRR